MGTMERRLSCRNKDPLVIQASAICTEPKARRCNIVYGDVAWTCTNGTQASRVFAVFTGLRFYESNITHYGSGGLHL